MVDREWIERENRRLERLLRAARLTVSDATLENVWCDPGRGVERSQLRDLATCKWIRNKLNVIVVGKTGVGKSYLGAALAQAACRNGMRALCARLPRLLHELSISRADGTYTSLLAKLAKLDLLVLDDFRIAPLKDTERRDLLEVLEDRYSRCATVVTSQVPTKSWHEALADRPEYAAGHPVPDRAYNWGLARALARPRPPEKTLHPERIMWVGIIGRWRPTVNASAAVTRSLAVVGVLN